MGSCLPHDIIRQNKVTKKVVVAAPATELNELFVRNNLFAKYSFSCPIKYTQVDQSLIQESLEFIR